MERHIDKEWYNKSIVGQNLDIGNLILCFMLSIYPFIVIPNSYGYFYMPRYIILAVVSIIAIPFIFRQRYSLLTKNNIILSLFIFLIIISATNSYDTSTAWLGLHGELVRKESTGEICYEIISGVRFTGVSTYIFCSILFLLSSINEKTKELFRFLISTCALVSVIAIMQYFGLNIVPHEDFRNKFLSYGTIGLPNFLATYCVFILPAAILYYIRSKKIYWLFCSILIYSGLLVSVTRGSWIALAVSYVIIFAYCLKHRELLKPFVTLSVAFLVTTVFLFSTKNGLLLKRALSIPDNLSFADSAGSHRMYIWKKVIAQIPKYWLFGMGADNLIYAGITTGGGMVDKAHNIYLEILITMGISAFLSYLSFIGLILRNCIKEHKFLYFIMIFTYLVQGFFNIDVIMVMPLFWIILGLSQNKIGDYKAYVPVS